jgi:integrase
MPTAKQTKEKQPLRLIGGRWYAWTTIRVGKSRRRLREASGIGEAEKAKALVWLRRRIAEVERELTFGPAPQPKPAIPDFKTAALAYAERGGKRGPLGGQDLQKLLAMGEFFGATPCDELDQKAWADFVDAELDGRGNDTIRRWFAMFRAPVRRALAQRGLAFREFDLPSAGAGRREIFLEEQVADELHAAYAPHARPIVAMLRWQGCRVAEALRLRLPDDISFARQTITFRDTKNGDKRRVVPMHERTHAALREYLGARELGAVFLTPAGEAYNDRRLAARGIGGDGGGIRKAHESALRRWAVGRVVARDGGNCRLCGEPAEYARLQLIRPRAKGGADEIHNYRLVCTVCAKGEKPGAEPRETPGYDWFHIHDWRHHWASWFVMRGGRETELMALGGWKDPRMVQRYVGLSVEHLRQAVNRV